MSLAQINATSLLCHLLEQRKPEINGQELLDGDVGDAGRELLRERLLVIGRPLTWVTCAECGVALARVVRDNGSDQVLLRCDECGDVDARRSLTQTYKVSVSKVVDRLAISLNLPPSSRKAIVEERAWRLGSTEPARAKPITWYFARHLNDHVVARCLLEQVRADQASQSAKIITTTEVPLPPGSPLSDYSVSNLGAVARVSQSCFVFFPDRAKLPAPNIPAQPTRNTSLRDVRPHKVAYVDGTRYELEPIQVRILVALMDDRDHEMTGEALRTACHSDAAPFSPVKMFERNREVYKRFITYQRGDQVFALVISEEDRDWLT